VLAFAVSRLLFQPVSLGVSTFNFSGHLASRAVDAISGNHFNGASLGDGMPILDRELLSNDLWRSLWYLHSQPPLFNLFVATILRVPGNFNQNYQWISWALALTLYLTTYVLLRRLKISRIMAAIAVVLFMLNPNAMWMESAVYYGLPLALLLVLAALAWERAMGYGSTLWLLLAAVLVVVLPLTRAFFNSLWCAAILLFFGAAFASRYGLSRRVIAATVIPFLVVIALQTKQWIIFHQFLGSSWFGCNLATMTASMSSEKSRELAVGKVSPLVKVYRNAPPADFLRYFRVEPTGIPALDQLRKSTGQPNFNHVVYLVVGRVYLRDTLYLIEHYPHKYLLNVLNSLYIFSGYQIGIYFDYPRRFFPRWSWSELAAPFVGFPLLVLALWTGWRRLRSDRRASPVIVFLLSTIVYVIAVSCLFEKSEGPIYRYQVDAFLWLFLAMGAESQVPILIRRFQFLRWRPIAASPTDVRN